MGIQNVNNTDPPPQTSSSANTLQAMIELVYCQVANSVLVDQLNSLQSSMQFTLQAVNTLTTLQNLHNDVAVVNKGTFNVNSTSLQDPSNQSDSQFDTKYAAAASSFFGTPVNVKNSYPSGSAAFITQFLQTMSQLSAEIITLSAVTPKITVNGQLVEDPNSLVAMLHHVMSDMVKNNPNTPAFQNHVLYFSTNSFGIPVPVFGNLGAYNWVIDNYNASDSSSGGQIEQNLTNAITAAQSLNTTQTESVRNYLYIFQEYYSSATSMLQSITQIIQTMAQNITTGTS